MKTLLTLVTSALLISQPAQANLQPLIVDNGHDWGTGWYRQPADRNSYSAWRPLASEDLNNNGTTDDDWIGGWPLMFDVPLSPENIIYDYTFPSARFFGAAIVKVTDLPPEPDGTFKRPPAPTEGHINQNHELRDDWNLMSYPTRKRQPEISSFAGAMLVYWQKEDFLNGGHRHRVSMDADSSIGIFISRYWGGMDWARWIIRENGTFYISEATFAGLTEQFDLTDSSHYDGGNNPMLRRTHVISPDATRWAEYTPQPPHLVFFDPETAEFSNRTFDDVDAVGFLAQRNMSVGRPVAHGLWDLPHGAGEPIALKFNAAQVRARIHRPEFESDVVRMRPVGTAFHMSESPISFEQWLRVRRWAITNQRARRFTEAYAAHEIAGYSFHRDGAMGGKLTGRQESHHPGEPVTSLSWHDAVLWSNALSEKEGLRPAYYTDAEFTQPLRRIFVRSKLETLDDRPVVYWDRSANGYRLPTARELAHAAPEFSVGEFVWDAEGDRMDPETQNHRLIVGRTVNSQSEMPFPYAPFEGCYAVGFRVLRNGDGRIPDAVPPLPLRRIARDEIRTPARSRPTCFAPSLKNGCRLSGWRRRAACRKTTTYPATGQPGNITPSNSQPCRFPTTSGTCCANGPKVKRATASTMKATWAASSISPKKPPPSSARPKSPSQTSPGWMP
jgi:hypothetical protein